MLDYLYSTRWDQAWNFLATGNPPIYVRLMAVNSLFLAIYAIRKSVGSAPMSQGGGLFVQAAMLTANLLVLYQEQVEAYLAGLSHRM